MKLMDQTGLSAGAEERFLELTLQRKLRLEPNNPLWFRLAGDLLQAQRMERRALESYERALELEPLNAETMNNLAWLLLTARNETLRDPRRALTLARGAVALHPGGHILDTLATAYWANGLTGEALQTEAHALHADPGHGTYYRSQMEKFRSQQPEGKGQQPEVRPPQPEGGRTGP
jgi:tetratricopeptide (TPR) repeat protein